MPPEGTIFSHQAAVPQRGVFCLSRIVAVYGSLLSTGILVATLSVLSPRPLSPISPQISLVHSVPPFPGIYCPWFSSLVVNLVTLHSASGLNTTETGLIPSGVRAIVSPQGKATQRGVVCLSTMLLPSGGGLSFRILASTLSILSLPEASIPILFSGITSPLCLFLCQSPG